MCRIRYSSIDDYEIQKQSSLQLKYVLCFSSIECIDKLIVMTFELKNEKDTAETRWDLHQITAQYDSKSKAISVILHDKLTEIAQQEIV
mgnify:CR=1 FL=1